MVNTLFVEIYFWRLPGALIRLKIRLLFEAKQSRNQHGGKTTACSVVILRGQGVVSARGRQSIFRAGQFILQLQKTLIRFQLRVVLSDRQKASARAEQATLPERLVEFIVSVDLVFRGAVWVLHGRQQL